MITRQRHGWTLVELLIATALILGGGAALLLGMHSALIHAEYLAQFQTAINAAQGELERLSAIPYDTLASGAQFAQARSAGQRIDLPTLPGGALAIQIQPVDPSNPTRELLNLHVAACWQSRGRRIGEDQNCNGQLDPGEDRPTPGNNWIDSPVMVSTRIARRG